MNRIKTFFNHSSVAQKLLLSGLTPQRLRLIVTMALCLGCFVVPVMGQFQGGVVAVDPTAGAQSLMKFLVDGALYIVASAAVICFFFGVFRLFVRPLEGIMEICVGLIVFGIIGHALGWDSGLTGVNVG